MPSQVIPLVRLSGTPEERGRCHGERFAAEIRLMRRALLRYLAGLTFYAGALPLLAGLGLLSWRFWPYIPPRLREELRGVARGAGLDLPNVLLINVLDDLANNCPRCSALAVGEGRTAAGGYLAARNLDYPLFTDILVNFQVLFVTEPDAGLPLASLAWPGYVGVCTGLNRAGVALAQLAAMSRDTTLKGLPAALRFRLALEQWGTAAEVASLVERLPATIGTNLLLCDPAAALVVEMSAERRARRRPQAGLLTATNHYQHPALAVVKGRFPRRPPGSALDPYHFTEAYSQARDRRLQELARGRVLSPPDLQAILADPGIANPGTVNSVVFAPGELKVWVAEKGPPPVSRGAFHLLTPWPGKTH